MPCYTDHLIPKDVPSPAIFKPPDPNSNVFQSMNFLQTNNLLSTINLQQRVFPDLAISWCQTNFRLCQLPKEPDHLIGNCFRPIPNLPSTNNLQRRFFSDFAISWYQTNFPLHQLPKESDHLIGNRFRSVPNLPSTIIFNDEFSLTLLSPAKRTVCVSIQKSLIT